MYFENYRLQCPPFEETTNPSFFHETAGHRQLAETVTTLLGDQGGVVLVRGSRGCGKSIFARRLARVAPRGAAVLSICAPQGGLANIARQLGEGIDVRPEISDAEINEETLPHILFEAADTENGCLLVIDQAENLTAENLRELRRLHSAAALNERSLTTVLVAASEIKVVFDDADLSAFVENWSRPEPLGPLSRKAGKAYITTRLRAAGREDSSLFSPQAIARVLDAAQGRPRIINTICGQALLEAARRGDEQIGLDVVEQVIQEISQGPVCGELPHHDHDDAAEPPGDSTSNLEAAATGAVDLDHAAFVAERLQSIWEALPTRLDELEKRIARIETRAEDIVARTADRLNALREAGEQVSSGNIDTGVSQAEFEQVQTEADRLCQRLASFSQELLNVGQSTEERISLLLASLDRAQHLQEKLESLSGHVSGLVEDAHRTAADEREKLSAMFADLRARRDELATMLADARRTQEEELRRTAEAVNEQLSNTQRAASEAQSTASRDLERVNRIADEVRRNLESMAKQAAEYGKKLASVSELEQRCSSLDAVATKTLDRVQQRLAEADAPRQQLEGVIHQASTAADALAEKITAGEEAISQVLSSAKESVRQQAERMFDEVAQRIAELTNAREHDLKETIESLMRNAESRSAQIEQRTANALAHVDEATEKAIRRCSEAIQSATATGEARAATVTAKLEEIIAAEESARQGAERSVTMAREAASFIEQSEAKLGEIRQAAEQRLVQLQDAADQTEESINTACRIASEKVQAKVASLLEEAGQKATECANSADASASIAIRRVNAAVQDARTCAETNTKETAETIENVACQASETLARHAEEVEKFAQTRCDEIGRRLTQQFAETVERGSIATNELIARLEAAAASASSRVESRADEASAQLAAVSTDATDKVSSAAAVAAEHVDRHCEESQKRVRQTIIEALRAIHDESSSMKLAMEHQVQDVLEQLGRAATESRAALSAAADQAGEQLSERHADIIRNLESAAEQAFDRLDTSAETRSNAIAQMADEQRTSLNQTAGAVSNRIAAEIADARKSIEETSAHAIQNVEDTTAHAAHECLNSTSAAREQIEQAARDNIAATQSAAENATGAIDARVSAALAATDECVRDARAAGDRLKTSIAASEKASAEARTAQEQINHLIRDVWSLTSTTDSRTQALAALAQSAERTELQIRELVERAEALAHTLPAQVESAQESSNTLAARTGVVQDACETIDCTLADAQAFQHQIATATQAAGQLAERIDKEGHELSASIATARGAIEAIERADSNVRMNAAAVKQLSGATAGLECRLAAMQESLAEPLALIQEARSQAEELNEICLVVKRVFRGVSQASLDANDRIKLLGKLLGAAERTAETMKQWVRESGRAQERLAAVLKLVPGPEDTHPIVVMPEIGGDPLPASLKSANISASDMATMRRIRKAAEAIGTRSVSASVPQAAPAGEVSSVAPRNASATRLRPEQIQAMIDQAKRKAAAVQAPV